MSVSSNGLILERKQQQVEQERIFLPSVEEVGLLFSKVRADIVDINILRAFYMTGKQPPLDTSPHCFPILYESFKNRGIVAVGNPAFYLKVEKLRKAGLIKKLKRTSPSLYEPVDEIKYVVRRAVFLWLANRGLRVSDKK